MPDQFMEELDQVILKKSMENLRVVIGIHLCFERTKTRGHDAFNVDAILLIKIGTGT